MQDSINNVSGVVNNVTFPGNRMAINVNIPRAFLNMDRAQVEAMMTTSLTQLGNELDAAIATYVEATQIVKDNAPILCKLGENRVSTGERSNASDRDMVQFYVQAPKRLMRNGFHGDVKAKLKEQMDEIKHRALEVVKTYWRKALKHLKTCTSVPVNEVAMTA